MRSADHVRETFYRRATTAAFAAFIAIALAPAAAPAADTSIVLASTTSVDNSGLLAHILPQFTSETGITVKVVAQGTGQALDAARRGDADLVLVHDPEAEKKFVDDGDGLAPRQIAWNDFILVGPSADPAHVKGGDDIVAALKAIDEAKRSLCRVAIEAALTPWNCACGRLLGSRPTRTVQVPGIGNIGGGMGQALNAASAMDAYTLSDRGTWLSFANKSSLVIEIENDPRLINRYDVIELNPQETCRRKTRGREDARRLASVA